jgi:hypothetical protein
MCIQYIPYYYTVQNSSAVPGTAQYNAMPLLNYCNAVLYG